jgi:adenylate kinase family enzyme
LAGSPRTLYEAKALIPLLKELYGKNNITIIFLKLQEKETIRRNSQRRICELMRHPILATKETAKLKKCPLDGSKLVRRKGLDDKNVIIIRLKEYMRRTFPMKRYFREQGFRVHAVDGGKSVAEVFASVLKIVKK